MNKLSIGDIIGNDTVHYIIAGYGDSSDLYSLISLAYFEDKPFYLERIYVERNFKLISKA